MPPARTDPPVHSGPGRRGGDAHRILMPEHEQLGVLGGVTAQQHPGEGQQPARHLVQQRNDHANMVPAGIVPPISHAAMTFRARQARGPEFHRRGKPPTGRRESVGHPRPAGPAGARSHRTGPQPSDCTPRPSAVPADSRDHRVVETPLGPDRGRTSTSVFRAMRCR